LFTKSWTKNTGNPAKFQQAGIADKVLAWRHEGKNFLVDREPLWNICRKRGIACDVEFLKLPNRQAVEDFIIELQLGRDLSPRAAAYCRGQMLSGSKTTTWRYQKQIKF
jgi:hypothetical protein